MNATDYDAEYAIGEQRLREALAEGNALKEHHIAAAHAKGYGIAAHELQAMAINLRAFSRGVVSAETVPTYIKRAREMLDEMEAAIS